MQINNQDIRELIALNRLKHFEVAAAAGISATTLSRWLRWPLEDGHKQRLIDAITTLTATPTTTQGALKNESRQG